VEDIWTQYGGNGAGWRRLRNEELRNLHASPSIIRVIKSRKVGWAGCLARLGKARSSYRILVGKPEGKDDAEVLGVDGKIILKWILGK